MKYVSKTFSIDEKLYKRFESICKTKNLNKSAVLQAAIKDFVAENFDVDKDVLYRLKVNPDAELVKVEKKEKDFIILNNGNRINIFDFEILYESQDPGVGQVLDELISERSGILGRSKDIINTDDTVVSPEILTKPFVDPEVGEAVKKACMNVNIDNSVTPRTIVREINSDEPAFVIDDTTTEDKIQSMREQYNIPSEEKQQIIKRIKEKRNLLHLMFQRDHDSGAAFKQINNVLSYVYDTDVKVEYKDKYYIHIPNKFVDNDFHNLVNSIGEYETLNVEERSIGEILQEKINKVDTTGFYLNFDKKSHIGAHLMTLLDLKNIDIKYDAPIYTFYIPKKFICNKLVEFISKWEIKKEHIILADVKSKQLV